MLTKHVRRRLNYEFFDGELPADFRFPDGYREKNAPQPDGTSCGLPGN